MFLAREFDIGSLCPLDETSHRPRPGLDEATLELETFFHRGDFVSQAGFNTLDLNVELGCDPVGVIHQLFFGGVEFFRQTFDLFVRGVEFFRQPFDARG